VIGGEEGRVCYRLKKQHVLRPWGWEVLDTFRNRAQCKESDEK